MLGTKALTIRQPLRSVRSMRPSADMRSRANRIGHWSSWARSPASAPRLNRFGTFRLSSRLSRPGRDPTKLPCQRRDTFSMATTRQPQRLTPCQPTCQAPCTAPSGRHVKCCCTAASANRKNQEMYATARTYALKSMALGGSRRVGLADPGADAS